MSDEKLTTPVVLIIFNRTETTAQVFAAIREAKPTQLFVIADGPREDNPEDTERCAATRAIIEGVDWECDVHKDYSEVNIGCKTRVGSGLDWVFNQVEQAIILEDDCLPHPTFFRYCQELLDRYKNDERVMVVSGNNFQFGKNTTGYSYYFSRHPHSWGWATWKRTWNHFDQAMKLWPTIRDQGLLEYILNNKYSVDYWTKIFDMTHYGKNNAWDFALLFACWIQNGLAILPSCNLVSNIGFGTEATHTKKITKYANMKTYEVDFPLHHPPFVIRDVKADQYTQEHLYMDDGRLITYLLRLYIKMKDIFRP
jgi:hypothetical protein